MIGVHCVLENQMWNQVAEAQADAEELLQEMSDVVFFTDPKNKYTPPPKK